MKWVIAGCVLAGLVNMVGILVISHGFTNTLLFEAYPGVFSPQGCFAIFLWGAAYVAATAAPERMAGLFAVFAVEKIFYTGTWAWWYHGQGDSLPALYAESWLTGFFMQMYGLNDFLFALFFAWAFVQARRAGIPA